MLYFCLFYREAEMSGGSAQRSVLRVNEPKKTGAHIARASMRG
jgi:hypothetical protein